MSQTEASKPEKPGREIAPDCEVVQGNWKLPDVVFTPKETSTGEEDEECVWTYRSKLYRWRDAEWKERGLGDSKLLKDKQGRVRFLLRQEKTGKICANHYVIPKDGQCELKANAGSDTIWVWSALDNSDPEPTAEQFALKFGKPENALKFKEEFERVGAENKKLLDEGKWVEATKKPAETDSEAKTEPETKPGTEATDATDAATAAGAADAAKAE